MFVINDDMSIYVTRGDIVFFTVRANEDGKPYHFQVGDVVRMKVYGKKDAETVVMQKDFPVTEITEEVGIRLDEKDTKIGGVISKPMDYWYEVELNPYDNPQTIVGYDEDGPKLFRLLPEGRDVDWDEPDISEEDIPVVDEELDMTSLRPVQNQAIARKLANLEDWYERTHAAVAEVNVTPQMHGAIADGVSDDTDAIVDAIAFCAENNMTLRIPAGGYYVRETIDIPNYVRVEGATSGGTIFKKSTAGAVFKAGGYSEIANIYIDGGGVATGVELNGGRVFVHDVTIQNCADGIVNNAVSSNLSRIYRVTILDCNRGIYLSNENGSNSQSLTFCDVDMRGCLYGLVTHQPGSKYVNFCVQNGLSGGCAVVLNAGANNNEFIGTYLENANYASEVDFTTSQYNRFTGGRPLQYGNSFVNNDGTNLVLTRSIQYGAMFERGTLIHEKVGVIAKETDAGLPSAVLTAKNNGANKVLVETLGTSVPTEVDFNNVVVREDNLVHAVGSRKYKGLGIITYTATFTSLANGATAAAFTTTLGGVDIAMVQCTTPRVGAWIQSASGGQHKITVENRTGGDLSGTELSFCILYGQTV